MRGELTTKNDAGKFDFKDENLLSDLNQAISNKSKNA